VDLEKIKVKEIAGELEAGLTCYINKESKEVLSVYENDDDFFIQEGDDEDKLNRVLKNRDNYICLEGMTSQEEFFLMQSFTGSLKEENLIVKLTEALANRKPFVMFKDIVDQSAEIKSKWTDFKLNAFVDLVNQQLLELNEE